MQDKKINNIKKPIAGSSPASGTIKSLSMKGFYNFLNITVPISVPKYKNLKAVDYNGDMSKRWHIEYYWTENFKTYKRIRLFLYINKEKNKFNRKLLINEAYKYIKSELEKGNNILSNIGNENRKNILQELEKSFIQYSKISSNHTQKSQRVSINRFLKFCESEKIEFVNFVNNETAEKFQFYLAEKKLSTKTIKDTIINLAKLWSFIKKENNPFKGIKHIKVRNIHKDPFELITIEEGNKILQYIKQNDINFYIFCLFIYHQWARPVEISRLTCGNIDLIGGKIHFRSSHTKNNEKSIVQITPQVKELLKNVDFKNSNYFLFSTNYAPGDKYLLPENATKKWNKYVKKSLNIDKNLYSLKHTGNANYMLANIGKYDIKWIQSQNRHKSIAHTQKYLRGLTSYFIDLSKCNFDF